MSESVELDFQPLANGMDFLKSAIVHFQDSSDPSNLKYVVLHLQAAAEVLLKVRLMREHWALVFKDPSKASSGAFKLGDFTSVGLDETWSRLKGVASIELTKPARDRLRRLANERNKLQHFGTTMNKYEIGNVAGGALDTLLAFVVDHLIPGASKLEAQMLGDVKDLLEDALKEIGALSTARRERLTEELAHFADELIACPQCTEMAFRLNPADLRCYYCEHAWESTESNEIASDYIGNVLGLSEYEIEAQGGELPIHPCVACEEDSMVNGVVFLADPKSASFACFACGAIYKSAELGGCSQCHNGLYERTPIDRLEAEGEIDVCSSCWNYLIERD